MFWVVGPAHPDNSVSARWKRKAKMLVRSTMISWILQVGHHYRGHLLPFYLITAFLMHDFRGMCLGGWLTCSCNCATISSSASMHFGLQPTPGTVCTKVHVCPCPAQLTVETWTQYLFVNFGLGSLISSSLPQVGVLNVLFLVASVPLFETE